ncbi:FlgO family outer membrane protein [Chromatiaceae bacterium AAb-1]|nr:FlgO family outer membrane protein [Chromatiaceae bacterium AAb-1]
MKRLLLLAGIQLVIAGCTTPSADVTERLDTVTVSGEITPREQRVERDEVFQSRPAVLTAPRTPPVLTANDYARNLVHELMAEHHALGDLAMVGVTDFAYIDSSLDKGSVFSNHLSEAIIYDLHKFGVPVLDYKVTDYIRVTESGDFVLSRNFEELSSELPIKYVVTGTLTRHQQGVLINARLIQIANKKVISVARTFVPGHIVKSLLQADSVEFLKLRQG